MSIEIENYKNVDLILNNVHAFRKSDIEIRKATGARYNMFNVLKVRRKELKHSLVIGDLLNPKGRHDQGDLYLKLFLDVIKSRIEDEDDDGNEKGYNEILNSFNTEKTKVKIEQSIGNITGVEGGQIDILLESNGKYILIENKVDAYDQKHQLLRYKNYVGKNGVVLYLNRYGTSPSKESYTTTAAQKYSYKKINNGKLLDLKLDEDFFTISYKNEIKEWIEKCIEVSNDKPYIRENLNQYLEIIKSITNQLNSNYMSNQLKEYFTENLDMLNDAKALTSYMNSGEFFEEMVGDKVVNIAKEIAAEFPKNKSLVELNEKHLENWKSYNSKKSNKIINLKFKALEYFTLSYKPHSAIGYSDFKFGLRWKNESLKLQEESSLISILSDVFSLEKNHIKLEEGYLILKKPLEDFSNLEDSKSIKAIENGDFKKKLKTHLEKMFALALEVEKQIKLKKL